MPHGQGATMPTPAPNVMMPTAVSNRVRPVLPQPTPMQLPNQQQHGGMAPSSTDGVQYPLPHLPSSPQAPMTVPRGMHTAMQKMALQPAFRPPTPRPTQQQQLPSGLMRPKLQRTDIQHIEPQRPVPVSLAPIPQHLPPSAYTPAMHRQAPPNSAGMRQPPTFGLALPAVGRQSLTGNIGPGAGVSDLLQHSPTHHRVGELHH